MGLNLHTLTEDISVSPQLQQVDIQAVADAGFKSLIINRPDFELEPTQPESAVMIAAAEQAGLNVRYQPVVASEISEDDVQEFKRLYNELPKPILAYCRSGTRCAKLFHLAQQD